jgi:hypothetical protein
VFEVDRAFVTGLTRSRGGERWRCGCRTLLSYMIDSAKGVKCEHLREQETLALWMCDTTSALALYVSSGDHACRAS